MMMFRRCSLVVGVVLTFSPAAQADPVNIITSGFYSLAFDEDVDFRFIGTDFEIVGMAGDLASVQPLFTCRPCEAGTSIDLSGHFASELDLEIGGILDGRSFPLVFYNGGMAFHTGHVIVPELPPPPPDGGFTQTTLHVPFVASGFLTAHDNVERTGLPIFSGAFRGGGTASVEFLNLPDFGTVTETVRYEFQEAAPTPEPATLVLLGTGLSAAYAGRRRRRT